MSILFNHVSKIIGRNTVADDICFEAEYGQVTGLKGINGSGKTMIMRLIAGLIYPTAGQVSIDGSVLGKDISFPPSLGLLLENPAFLNSYSGRENLKMLASIKRCINDSRIEEVLELVGLSAGKQQKYRKYSLGMKQRLGIASAIMESPDILLLDEPTNSLDAAGVEMVKEVILNEKKRGAAVILSCHDSPILEELSDVIYTIEAGRITDRCVSALSAEGIKDA